MTVTNTPIPYTFNVEAADGSSLGTMEGQPTLPEPNDVLELVGSQNQIVYWKVRLRRFTAGGRVTVVVDRIN
jgi:hypothetical protein